MARRGGVGAASQIYRESNHGKTGKGRPVLGLERAVAGYRELARVSWGFGANSRYF